MFKKAVSILILYFIITTGVFAFGLNSDEKQIRTLIKNHNSALDKQNTDKIKSFYDETYKSSDGLNLDELSKMLEKSYKTYSNLKYKTKINNITVSDNFAVAEISDTTSAYLLSDDTKNREKRGILEGKSAYVVYFEKKNGEWKIVYDDVLLEETSLKYGIANKIKIGFFAPPFVNPNTQYNLILTIDKPQDIIALGSISNEKITYPSQDSKDKFRKIPTNGILERIVLSNKDNKNEYAIATVGFTKLTLNKEETRANIQVLGMAYLLKRINIQNEK